ncbi:MAG: hypothetical protein EXR86_07150 [Gammaproteobacteria bacterium]|nr:hypothetical protein [Gammaproteobacteria bacterium]
MRARIEEAFGVTIAQGYGLNEIGLVAVRCGAGRYHVHVEHCWVEIVDDEGQPCAAGETGQLLVTGFRNAAMPLIRYDSGDLAIAETGPCPCGRTLPGFGAIIGRYRRYAYLPDNSMRYFRAILHALTDMPVTLCKPLRHFQLHQFRDHSFELRYLAIAALPPSFFDILRTAWEGVEPDNPLPLAFRAVDNLVQKGRKLQVFTSDFAPVSDNP